jgi:alkanesulfonate monooxygenase SsuD/methylene tetrahydromethanopterin reductase-like flavin-dependent oxidoreductase (luciferase family)
MSRFSRATPRFGFLAGLTRSVQLHLLVTGVTYRHPGILAKTVSTLEVLSGGRAALGIGAAWYEREHRALGVPHSPILIGSGERKTLRLVARYADATNLFASSPREVGAKLDILRGHCKAEGTDYDRIETTIPWVPGAPPATPDDARHFVDAVVPYDALGLSRVIAMPIGPDPLGVVQTLAAHVAPQLASM